MAGMSSEKHVTMYSKATHACDVRDDVVVAWKRDTMSADERAS